MLIVMKHNATAEEVQGAVDTIHALGYQARPMPGRQRTAIGLVGNDGGVDSARLVGLPGVLEIIPVSRPVQAGIARVARRRHRREARQRDHHRPARDRGDGRPLLGGVGGADHGGGGAGRGRGRHHPARRRVQAAHLALLVPGAGGRGTEAARSCPRRDRTRDRDRSSRPGQFRRGRGIHRHRADRRPQHAELPRCCAARGARRGLFC